ncbi:hypothetical protein D9M68_939060 [compost metagenome]
MEGEARGARNDVLEALGIAKAGNLNQNTVGALALDRGFGGAQLVDALADDFDGLRHQSRRALGNALFGQGHGQLAIGRFAKGQLVHATNGEH